MNKFIASTAAGIAALGVSSFAFAAGGYVPPQQPLWQPHFYVGIQGGWVSNKYKGGEFGFFGDTIRVTTHDPNWAIRPYVGYEWTPYFATEVGYTYYDKPEFTLTDTAGFLPTTTVSFTQQAIDGVAKLIYPVNNFTPYVKGGIVYVWRGAGVPNKVSGLLGAGIGYNISRHFNIDVSYSHTFKSGSLPSINFVAGGITYRFLNAA